MNDFKHYVTNLDGREFDHSEDGTQLKADALAKFTELVAAGEQATVTVFCDGELVAFHTNRRIDATFHKQQWGGKRGDDAIYIGEEAFDATGIILQLPLEQIHEMEDRCDASDAVGRQCVAWDGPCYVEGFENSILAYFGELDTSDITEKHLELARAIEKPVPSEHATVELTIKVKVRKAAFADLQDFLDNLDYSVKSNTAGIIVDDTEVTDSGVK